MISEYIYKTGEFFGKQTVLHRLVNSIRKVFQLLYSGFYGSQFLKVGKKFRLSYFVRLISGARYIQIGDYFNCFPGLRMEAIKLDNSEAPVLTIGNHVSFNHNCQINCVNKIVIQDGVLLASNVFITDHFHGRMILSDLNIRPSLREIYSKGPVIIEENVWIGQNVSVMPNVKIGRGSVIGANSVVTCDIPPYSVAGGTPAILIHTRQNNGS
ncbi:MAG: acyltransferase [Candidatus Symbiothrix sp.]|jgi:acetyltransferase-like isoleucine patch superfamily enzyme|nr:acyltransferase [Candidatus Symbiothrix sp.]